MMRTLDPAPGPAPAPTLTGHPKAGAGSPGGGGCPFMRMHSYSSSSSGSSAPPMHAHSSSSSAVPPLHDPSSVGVRRNSMCSTPVLTALPEIQFLPDAVLIVIEAHGEIVACNAAACDIFGYTRAELLGLSVHELVPPAFRSDHQYRTDEVFATMQPREMSKRRNVQAYTKAGVSFDVSIHLSPAYIRSTVTESILHPDTGMLVESTTLQKIVTCVCRDMRQHNAMIRKHNEAEQRMANAESFLRLLNHEVRTGMHGIVNALEGVKDEMLTFIRHTGVKIDPAWVHDEADDADVANPHQMLRAAATMTSPSVVSPRTVAAADEEEATQVVKDLARLETYVSRTVTRMDADGASPQPRGSSKNPSPSASPPVGGVAPLSQPRSISSILCGEDSPNFSSSRAPAALRHDHGSPRSAVRSLLMLEAGVTGMDVLFRNMLDYRALMDDSNVTMPVALDIRHFFETLKFNHRSRWLMKQQSVIISVPDNMPLVLVDLAMITKLVESLFDNAIKHAGVGVSILLECTDLTPANGSSPHSRAPSRDDTPSPSGSSGSAHSMSHARASGHNMNGIDVAPLETLLSSPPGAHLLSPRIVPRRLRRTPSVSPSSAGGASDHDPSPSPDHQYPSASPPPALLTSPQEAQRSTSALSSKQFKHVVILRQSSERAHTNPPMSVSNRSSGGVAHTSVSPPRLSLPVAPLSNPSVPHVDPPREIDAKTPISPSQQHTASAVLPPPHPPRPHSSHPSNHNHHDNHSASGANVSAAVAPSAVEAQSTDSLQVLLAPLEGSQSSDMRVRSLAGTPAPRTPVVVDAAALAADMAAHHAPYPSYIAFLLANRGGHTAGSTAQPSRDVSPVAGATHSGTTGGVVASGGSPHDSVSPDAGMTWPSPSGSTASATPPAPQFRRLQFVVCDTGVGLSPSTLATMDEEVLSVDASSTRNTTGGVGLGLHIAKMCATKLKATLTLSSCIRSPEEMLDAAVASAESRSAAWSTAFSFVAPFEVVPHTAQTATAQPQPSQHSTVGTSDANGEAVHPADVTTAPPTGVQSSPHVSPSPPPAVSSVAGSGAGMVSSDVAGFRSLSNPHMQCDIVARLCSAEFVTARANFRILIVEDAAINVKVLQRTFSKHGFQNQTVAKNGQQAVDECLKRMASIQALIPAGAATMNAASSASRSVPPGSAPFVPVLVDHLSSSSASLSSAESAAAADADPSRPFDLILMDCEMPVKDGWAATKELRALGCLSPIFALTANCTQQGQTQCRQAGMDLFLNKPLPAHALLFALAALPPFSLYGLECCPHVLLPSAFVMSPLHEDPYDVKQRHAHEDKIDI